MDSMQFLSPARVCLELDQYAHVRGNYVLEKEASARLRQATHRENERENVERRILDTSGESRRDVLVAFERLQRLRTAQALEREKLAIRFQIERVLVFVMYPYSIFVQLYTVL